MIDKIPKRYLQKMEEDSKGDPELKKRFANYYKLGTVKGKLKDIHQLRKGTFMQKQAGGRTMLIHEPKKYWK